MTEWLSWTDGTGCHDLSFWKLSFKPAFSLSSFIFKKLFCSFSLFSIRVVSSAYLRLLIFLLAILILAFASSSLACHMMYSYSHKQMKLHFSRLYVINSNFFYLTPGLIFFIPSSCPAAVAAAKSIHSCLTLCDPIDCSPPGSPVHRIL